MTFSENGVLPAGFHDCTYDEFYETFVDGFPTSQRRKIIADALLEFSQDVFAFGIPFEFWIDGSYATTKINPNDADIILFFQYEHMIAINSYLADFRSKYANLLDIYFAYAKSPENEKILPPDVYQTIINNRNYWRGQFGFDRKDTPKGIIRVNCTSILEKLQGR